MKLRNIIIVLLPIVWGFLFAWFQKNVSSVVDSFSSKPSINIIDGLNGNGLTILISVILNALIRGWFSIVNLFPIMLGGLIFIRLALKNKTLRINLAF